MSNPEQEARQTIDQLLGAAGWHICDADAVNICAARGVVVREFPLKSGHGFADYLLYVDGKAAGVIEAKRQGMTLSGVEVQAARYTAGLPSGLPAWHNPLPFAYQSTGVETRFTNGLDPEPRSRPVFAFHRPELLAEWLGDAGGTGMAQVADTRGRYAVAGRTVLERLQHMPSLRTEGFWPAQIQAIRNLEQSLRENRPRALIFAKDDAHAENIVEIVREEFGKGNAFAQKITYRSTGAKPKDLINEFRTSPMPRVAVTVDMIATGTDIKAVEVVMFMRAVKSRSFFEQMKGRGVRVIAPDDLQSVTPDATVKDHFVIVDAVGVCEQDKTDSRPMEQKPTVSFAKLLQAVAFGNTEDEVLTSLAGRLARMEHRSTPDL